MFIGELIGVGFCLRCGRVSFGFGFCERGSFARLDADPALCDHIGISARIDLPFACAFIGQRARHGSVEEVAVMGHNNDSARIIRDNFLQQIQSLQIQIIGRFIQD